MAPPGKKGGKREDWEDVDTSADSRLPVAHIILFVINAVALSAVPIYLFSAIFDLDIAENAPIYVGITLVSTLLVTLAVQNRCKRLRTRLIASRNVELGSTWLLKLKNAEDEKSKLKLKEGNKRISEINMEALSLSIAYNNAAFLFTIVLLIFFVLRTATPQMNYGASTCLAGFVSFLLSSRVK
ncbi:translocon-associated, gamma subunit [Baffinella frigidus]|nr:translocon-associated, gamma subunit [Cryptophyta sp. CCMP2293]